MKTIQIKFKTLLVLLLVGSVFTSCSKDDDGPGDPDPEQTLEPIVLECGIMSEAMTLENRGDGIDYILPCMLTVEAPLTIEPGVTIAFEQDAGIEVNDYGARTGAITAIGTANNPITFTGTNQVPGAWSQIYIDSKNLNNKFYHCIIEYAGASDGSKPALDTDAGTKVEVQNTIIRNNKGNGVFVSVGANIENWEANTITENGGYPMQIAASKVKFLDGTQSTYTNNGTNQIYVNSLNAHDIGFITSTIHTWQDPGIPYFIDEYIYVENNDNTGAPGHLKITAGCQIIFAEEYGIQTSDDNTVLQILGTSENPVNFSGQYGAGSWKGINIKRSNSTLNTIENATIADAGQSNWGWFQQKGGISLGHQTQKTITLSVTNVHITNSGGCGVVERGIRPDSNITYTNVSFSDNAGDDYCEEI
ncbi:MAG: hypothetical protein ACTIK4_03540 [Mesonia sp.]|uniref:hypothetical protein n=1 Tax=Mesonia sp. TaxID=1960830 RepID=UPI003F9A4346